MGKINNWFESGCDYQSGITLYLSIEGHRSNLVRLFLRKESPRNLEKLKSELRKYREKTTDKKTDKIVNTATQSNPIINDKALDKSYKGYFYRLNQLPTQLHDLSIKQRNDFQTAIKLHLQLGNLHPMEEGAALKFCIEIENLFDSIETAQKVLDHYVQHKVILDIKPFDFSDLTPAQLLQRRNNKRASVSKYSKNVKTYKKQLQGDTSQSEKTKLEDLLEKANAKLLNLEMEIQQLNKYINGKET
jgi:hypothetical protein